MGKYDHDLDAKCIEDFYRLCRYTETKFWIVGDGFHYRKLFDIVGLESVY